MFDKDELQKVLDVAGISNDSPLVPYFEKQFKKGYRKYKTNNLDYVSDEELKQHLLEEIVDAIVYLTHLKNRLHPNSMYNGWKITKYTHRIWKLSNIALELAKEKEECDG